jgi:predicted phage-related endonuclease
MKKEIPKKVILKGVEIPRWYQELEPKLIELICEIAEKEEQLKTLKSTIQTMMCDDSIDGIESGFAKVSAVKGSLVETILKDKLKEEMPEVYAKYVKTSYRNGYISVKLVNTK